MLADYIAQLNSENQRSVTAPKSNNSLAGLTPRKRQIADLVSQGIGNSDIAGRLNISKAAVKAQLTQIFRHFGVANRLQLALLIASQTIF